MIHERAEQIKVIKIDKLKGSKPQDARKVSEVKLLHGVDKIDYREGRGGK